ncbi:hypothetical protein, partial [Salmonella sp. s51228]|uniref:hypothetical protein n=1 Tax=Salmonella sp. s51228 TaxID=3159652 RepID=UPI00397FF1AC
LIFYLHGFPTAQKHVLGVIERILFAHVSYLLPRANHILKSLYDNDLIDETTLLKWDEKLSLKYVNDELFQKELRKHSQIFLTWLKEAEEASESDEGLNSDPVIFGESKIVSYELGKVSNADDILDDVNIDEI